MRLIQQKRQLLTLVLAAGAGLAQQAYKPDNPKTPNPPINTASSPGSPIPVVDKDLYTLYESYMIKYQLAAKTTDEENARKLEQARKQLEDHKTKALADLASALSKDQDLVRIRICKSVSLADDCQVSQDQTTGKWSAKPAVDKPAPAPAPAPAKP